MTAVRGADGWLQSAIRTTSGRGLTRRRQLAAALFAAVLLPAETIVAARYASPSAIESALLVYLLIVVVVCVIGGTWPGLVAALAAFLLANWFLTSPVGTFAVSSPTALADLVVFLLVATIVSVTVEAGARNRASAAHHRLETQVVHRLGGAELHGVKPQDILNQVRDLYATPTVVLLDPSGQRAVLTVGPPAQGIPALTVQVAGRVRLLGFGQAPFAEDRLLLRSLAEAAARVWDRQQLVDEAARAEQLAKTDEVRSALLRAVSHDLRTPIASIKTAASGLRQAQVPLSPQDRLELLEAIEDGADQLAALVDNLLDMSRIQAGAVGVHLQSVALEEVVAGVVRGIDDRQIRLSLPPDLPLATVDAGLLERVLANLVDNALRFSPPGEPVEISAADCPGTPHAVQLVVADRGPGIPPDRWDEVFQPFQRMGDSTAGGIGLGLAIAKGLTEAMNGQIIPSPTGGGGLTMTLRLPVKP